MKKFPAEFVSTKVILFELLIFLGSWKNLMQLVESYVKKVRVVIDKSTAETLISDFFVGLHG